MLSEVKSSRFFVLSLISLSDDGTFRWFYAFEIEFHGRDRWLRVELTTAGRGEAPFVQHIWFLFNGVSRFSVPNDTHIHTHTHIIYRENSGYVREWSATEEEKYLNNARQTWKNFSILAERGKAARPSSDYHFFRTNNIFLALNLAAA